MTRNFDDLSPEEREQFFTEAGIQKTSAGFKLESSPSKVIVSNIYGDSWDCICGNDVMGDGFFPCDPDTANVIQPTIEGNWDGKSVVCMSCRRVMDQTTRRPNPGPVPEGHHSEMTHIVDVVRGPRDDVDSDLDEF